MLLGAAAIWGFAFVAQDSISGLGANAVVAARSWIAVLFLVFAVMLFDRLGGSGRRLISRRGIDLSKSEMIGGVLCGAVLAVASVFQQLGIQSGTDGGKAAFITSLYVILVPIYALVIKRRAALNVWISVAIAAVGFYLLCIKENVGIVSSDAFVIAGALIFPLHILLIDRFSPRCDGVRMSLVQFFTCGAIETVVSLIFEGAPDAAVLWANVVPLLFLGIGSSGIAYTLQILGQNGPDPSAASIIMSLESVFGVIGTALVLDARLLPREYLGCAIVLVAVILSEIDFPALRARLARRRQSTEGEAPTE